MVDEYLRCVGIEFDVFSHQYRVLFAGICSKLDSMSKDHPTPQLAKPKKKRKVLLILGIVVLLLIGVGVGCYVWMNRPINPTVLAAGEQAVLDQKVEAVQQRAYEPGGKKLVLTDREVNALLHKNTDLGDKLKIEFANNAVHARVHTDLDEDFPVIGGKTLKAKARFRLTNDASAPAIVLDDVTVWGISLPNAWLADLKGKNLISNLGLDQQGNKFSEGIKDISVKNGEIEIRLAE